MTVYRIKDFETTFLKRDTARLVKKRLPWLSVPTRLDSRGFRRLSRHPQGPALYGAFMAMVCLAGSSGTGGILATDKGIPWTASSLEDQTGFPEAVFTLAFEVLSDPLIGWLEVTSGHSATLTTNPPQPAANSAGVAKSAADMAEPAANSADMAESAADLPNLRCTDGRTYETNERTRRSEQELFPSKTGQKTAPEAEPEKTTEAEVQTLRPFVRYKTTDSERTEDNRDQLAILIRSYGAETCRRVAESASIAVHAKLWPNELAEALEDDARPKFSAAAREADNRHRLRETILKSDIRGLLATMGFEGLLAYTQYPPETIPDEATLMATLDGDLDKTERLIEQYREQA